MQGIVLDIDLKSDTGSIRAEDGQRYIFKTESCRNGFPLTGSTVDFEIKDDNTANDVYTIKTSWRSKFDWLFWFVFSFRGRISRDQFIVFLTVIVCVLPILVVSNVLAGISTGFNIVSFFVLAYISCSVIVKRFHDSGSSSFWLYLLLGYGLFVGMIAGGVINFIFLLSGISFLVAVQALLLLFCFYLCFSKGNIGKNKYGDEPYSSKTLRLK